MSPEAISAPYYFCLQFGAEEVQRIREFAATSHIAAVRRGPSPWDVSACFEPDCKLPDDPPPDPAN